MKKKQIIAAIIFIYFIFSYHQKVIDDADNCRNNNNNNNHDHDDDNDNDNNVIHYKEKIQYINFLPVYKKENPLLYNKNIFLSSNTIRFNITDCCTFFSKNTISTTLSTPQSQYFILSKISLLFTRVKGIQQSSTVVNGRDETITVSIYLDSGYILAQYIISISSIPVYSDTPQSNCGVVSSSCSSSCTGSCGALECVDNCNTNNAVQCSYSVPFTVVISSSQFYSFSPLLLIKNNTVIYVDLEQSSVDTYFETMYLSYSLMNE